MQCCFLRVRPRCVDIAQLHADVWISGEFSTPGPYGRAMGYPAVVEILVSREDAPRAWEIIAEVEGSQPPADATGDGGSRGD